MAYSGGPLVLLNDALTQELPVDWSGVIAVQYSSTGADGVTASTGTVVIEASVNHFPASVQNQITTPAPHDDWVIIAGKNPTTAPPGDIASIAAAGLFVAELMGYRYVRARMSVVGGAQGVFVAMNTQYPG
jgi:hypothetical protein